MRRSLPLLALAASISAVPTVINATIPIRSRVPLYPFRIADEQKLPPIFTRKEIRQVAPRPGTEQNPDKILFPVPDGFQIEPSIESGHTRTPKAKLVKIQHGPIVMQKMTLVPNQFVEEVPKPCDSCYITAVQSDLQYADGTTANVNQGMWLRHMVLYNNAHRDPVCKGELYPVPARMYAAANERETNRINPGNSKFGMRIVPRDRFSMIYELMNSSDKDRTVFITLIYEFVEEKDAKDYRQAIMIWLDVMGCQESHFPARTGQFGMRSPTWKSTLKGKLLHASAHLSDGGAGLELSVNNKSACKHDVLYGRKSGFIDYTTGRKHLSDVSVCNNFGEINVGDELAITATFDTVKYPPMIDLRNNGLEPFMALQRLFVGT